MVLGTRPDGQIERLYFDVHTGLLARRYSETPTYFGGLPNTVDYDDYRSVGGVQFPFMVRSTDGAPYDLVTKLFLQVRRNVAIDDALFRAPGGGGTR